MSQPLVDHTKLLASDVELEQNPTRGPLDITQKQDKIEKKGMNILQEPIHSCNHINTHAMHIQNSKF
jgi:hypothetical protein